MFYFLLVLFGNLSVFFFFACFFFFFSLQIDIFQVDRNKIFNRDQINTDKYYIIMWKLVMCEQKKITF